MSIVTRARERKLGIRQARTSNSANLWVLQSPLSDQAITVSGDMRMLLFYYCEGDPEVHGAQYSGNALDLSFGEAKAFAHALVEFGDGSLQIRVLDDGSTAAADNISALKRRCGRSIYTVGASDLQHSAMRIKNWRAAVAAYHRCRRVELAPVIPEVETYVRRHKASSIGALVRELARHPPALVVGATAYALRCRSIASNLDSSPWSLYTRLSRQANGATL